jgi:PAS domain S-box-containing protein
MASPGNARMEELRTPAAIRRSEARLRFLADLTTATQPLGDPGELLAVTARMLGQYLQVNRCAYAEVEADEDHFTVIGDHTNGVDSIVGRYAFGEDFGDEVLRFMRHNLPYVVDDVDTDPRAAGTDLSAYRQTRIQAVICVPLHKDGRLVAAMAVHQTTARTWTPDDCELVQVVAARCWESLQRSRAMHALEEAAERLNLTLSAAAMGDWSWDAHTDAVTLSERSAQIFGLTPVSPIPWKTLNHMLHPDDREPVVTAVQRSRTAGQRYQVEYRLQRPDGQEVWVAAFGVPVRVAHGRIIGFYGVVQDVTERKQMEEELRVRAEKLAENDRRKDEFLATLAHELRNPLAPLRSSLELLSREGVADDVKQRARAVMARQVKQMTRLVEELIDVSRINSGKVQLRPEAVTLSSVIDLACEMSRPLIDERGHTLQVVQPDRPCRLRADATRMAQVLSNLLNNAAKYSPPNRRIWLTALVSEHGIKLQVKDEGVGIEPYLLPLVFDMFAQLPKSAATAGGGLGIGLALARKLVELQGGQITAHSNGSGLGSEFRLHYPPSLFDPQDAPPAEGLGPAGPVRSLRVLVVDDNADAAHSLAALMTLDGHRVQVAHDGLEAIALMESHPAEAVLLDIGMPGLDGYEVARRLRARHGRGPRLIAVTGWGQQRDLEKTRDAGFDHHLIKPVDYAALRACLPG